VCVCVCVLLAVGLRPVEVNDSHNGVMPNSASSNINALSSSARSPESSNSARTATNAVHFLVFRIFQIYGLNVQHKLYCHY